MKYRIVFENCYHEAFFYTPVPETGDEVFCSKCGRYMIVFGNDIHSLHAKCKECQWQYHTGRYGALALAASRHAEKTGHDIRTFQTNLAGDANNGA